MSKNLVFIASGGRTGSMFLGERLGRVIEDCWSEHEPDMFAGFTSVTLGRIRRFGLKHMVVDRLLGRSGVRVLGQGLLSGRIPETECLRRIRDGRRRYHERIPESLVIESYYSWWVFASRIDRLWPGAKMVGVIRDPRIWIESWMHHNPGRRKNGHWQINPQALLTPENLQQHDLYKRWSKIGQIGRLAWDWQNVYGELARAEDSSRNVKIFKFEEIFEKEPLKLSELICFAATHANRQYAVLDAPSPSAKPINASSSSGQGWRRWEPNEARLVDEFCGPLMAKFGYGSEPEWRSLLVG